MNPRKIIKKCLFIFLTQSVSAVPTTEVKETNYGGPCCSVYLCICVFQLWLSSSSIPFRSLLLFELNLQRKPKTEFAMFLQLASFEFKSPDLLSQVCCSHFNWREWEWEWEWEGFRVSRGGLCGVWIGQTENIFVDLFHRYFRSRSLRSQRRMDW